MISVNQCWPRLISPYGVTWPHWVIEWLTVVQCWHPVAPFTKEINPKLAKPAFNSLAPGRFQRNFRKVIFQPILVIDGGSISCKIVLKWMPMDLTDGKSTLVQVMAWCRQATSHYLSQCWPRSLSPYGVTRPQWVNFNSSLANLGG